ncbi:MAG: rRNA pseudouridine synthase [Alishewanella sp.]|nr:rRNA pseudouridine synthase [Alishewanella sp.]
MNPRIPLTKAIASRGFCSRQAANRLISAGQVLVNGEPARLQQRVAVDDEIQINGQSLAPAPAWQYWLYHKPVGIDCNNRAADPASIAHVLSQLPVRAFAVGRLDKDSRGLLLLTNDGELAQRLLHPRYQHHKRYRVRVQQAITDADALIKAFADGITWQVGPHQYQANPCLVKVLTAHSLEICLSEGQHRQIRYMCRALGFKVVDLCRIAIGDLPLGDLEEGRYRPLTTIELAQLRALQTPEPTT